MMENKICTYEQALEFIHGTYKFGIKLGLENMQILLQLLDNPHKKMKYVHVAGTNGKGSVVSFVANILEDAGYKTGKYISPFIERFTERISINGVEISENELTECAEIVRVAVEKMVSEGFNHPTEFETVTAIAFLYFYRCGCEYVVLEVGLGGRFDSTNIIENPEVAVITNIAMDHTAYLGDSIDKIAFEKAGIIKEGCSVVVSNQEDVVLDVVREIAAEMNADVVVAEPEEHEIPPLKLMGTFQNKNATTAMVATRMMGIDESAIDSGLRRTVWPGRLELCGRKPDFFIDGAHNPSAARVLVDSLKELYADNTETKFIIILGMMEDKDIGGVLEFLGEIAHTIITVTPNNMRAISAENLAIQASNYCHKACVGGTILKAISMAKSMAKDDDVIIACGSLYYIGEVRQILLNKDK